MSNNSFFQAESIPKPTGFTECIKNELNSYFQNLDNISKFICGVLLFVVLGTFFGLIILYIIACKCKNISKSFMIYIYFLLALPFLEIGMNIVINAIILSA